MKQKVKVVKRWEYRGRECEIKKLDLGHYCGYTKTKFGNEIENHHGPGNVHRIADVHGGITYGPDENGWIGFDTGHAWDANLDENGMEWGTVTPIGDPEFIWTIDKVKEECENFVDNIIESEEQAKMRGKCREHGNKLVYSDKLGRKICPFCNNAD